MPHHFKVRHTGLPVGPAESALSEAFFVLPEDTYYGFAIGAESDHSHVLVEAGITVVVPPASVVPIPPFKGSPRVRLVETMIVDGEDPVVHLIALTDACELSVRPRRALRQWPRFAANLGGVALALGRRRHALISILQLAPAGNLVVSGISFDRIGQAGPSAELATVPLTANVWTSLHIGGTDHEEGWSALSVAVTGAGANSVIANAWGELGD